MKAVSPFIPFLIIKGEKILGVPAGVSPPDTQNLFLNQKIAKSS